MPNCSWAELREYELSDPHRSPRWRYNRADQLYRIYKASRRRMVQPGRDDKETVKLFDMLCEWYGIRDPNFLGGDRRVESMDLITKRRLSLLRKFGPALRAFELFLDDSKNSSKHVVEAYVLAREPMEAVAKEAYITLEEAKAYEQMFFHVSDRLDNKNYIARRVIGPVVASGVNRADRELMAKYFGYFGGPIVLRAVMLGHDETLRIHKAEELNQYLNGIIETALRRNVAEIMTNMSPTTFDIAPMTDAYLRLTEIANRANEYRTKETPIEEAVGAMMGIIPWATGTMKKQLLKESPLQPYQGHAAELRADEAMRIGSGESPVDVSVFASRKLPPPRKREKANEQNPK